MKNVTYIGTEKQVNYAKSLIDELLKSPKSMMEKMEARGLDRFNDRQLKRYNQFKSLVDGVESIQVIDCSKAISAILNYNAGGVSDEDLIKRLS